MLIKNWRNKFALLLVVAAHSVHAADINPSDINTQEQLRQQERQRLLRQQQEIKPDVRDDMDALKQTPIKASIDIPDNETPCFTINSIELVGNDAAKFQFALDEVLSKNITSANETEAKPIL